MQSLSFFFALTMKTELRSMSEVQLFFDPRYIYKNLKRPKMWVAALISKAVLTTMDTLIKSDFYRPEVIVLKDPATKRVTVSCKFSNHKRSYALWFVVDPSKNPYELTDMLFAEWFGNSRHQLVFAERKPFKNQLDIDPLTLQLLSAFDDHMTATKTNEPLKVITSCVNDTERDVSMHTKYGTTWYVGGNKPVIGRSSFVSAGFAYRIN